MANVKKVKIYTTDHNFWKLVETLPGNNPSAVHPWMNRRISELCNEKILPMLPKIEEETNKHQICIVIQELEVVDQTNLDLLEKFAEFEKSSVANIITKYIIFPHLEKEYLANKVAK
jgi:hypothetical protein